MNIGSDSFENLGQKFYLATPSLLAEIKSRNECSTGILELLEKQSFFCEQYPAFRLAVQRLSYRPMWTPMLFLEDSGTMTRVSIQNASCPHCGWHGIIADPAAPHLFDNHPERFQCMREAAKKSCLFLPPMSPAYVPNRHLVSNPIVKNRRSQCDCAGFLSKA